MKTNRPVTNREILIKEGALLVSRTDVKGIISYVNDDFVNVSGFTRDEPNPAIIIGWKPM